MPDNGVGRGARRPVDVCLARTEAERRTNPRKTIIYIAGSTRTIEIHRPLF